MPDERMKPAHQTVKPWWQTSAEPRKQSFWVKTWWYWLVSVILLAILIMTVLKPVTS